LLQPLYSRRLYLYIYEHHAQGIKILGGDPLYESLIPELRGGWSFSSVSRPTSALIASSLVFKHCPDECDDLKGVAPNINMDTTVGLAFNDGMKVSKSRVKNVMSNKTGLSPGRSYRSRLLI